MSGDVERGYGSDGGGDDRPPSHQGPQKVRFKFSNRGGLMPLSDHAAHWSNLLGEIVREFLMHYPSWHKIQAERKAKVIRNIRFDLTPNSKGIEVGSGSGSGGGKDDEPGEDEEASVDEDADGDEDS
ncbi:hypothetical protein Tco_1024644, partial [Tanacetum coccineum]